MGLNSVQTSPPGSQGRDARKLRGENPSQAVSAALREFTLSCVVPSDMAGHLDATSSELSKWLRSERLVDGRRLRNRDLVIDNFDHFTAQLLREDQTTRCIFLATVAYRTLITNTQWMGCLVRCATHAFESRDEAVLNLCQQILRQYHRPPDNRSAAELEKLLTSYAAKPAPTELLPERGWIREPLRSFLDVMRPYGVPSGEQFAGATIAAIPFGHPLLAAFAATYDHKWSIPVKEAALKALFGDAEMRTLTANESFGHVVDLAEALRLSFWERACGLSAIPGSTRGGTEWRRFLVKQLTEGICDYHIGLIAAAARLLVPIAAAVTPDDLGPLLRQLRSGSRLKLQAEAAVSGLASHGSDEVAELLVRFLPRKAASSRPAVWHPDVVFNAISPEPYREERCSAAQLPADEPSTKMASLVTPTTKRLSPEEPSIPSEPAGASQQDPLKPCPAGRARHSDESKMEPDQRVSLESRPKTWDLHPSLVEASAVVWSDPERAALTQLFSHHDFPGLFARYLGDSAEDGWPPLSDLLAPALDASLAGRATPDEVSLLTGFGLANSPNGDLTQLGRMIASRWRNGVGGGHGGSVKTSRRVAAYLLHSVLTPDEIVSVQTQLLSEPSKSRLPGLGLFSTSGKRAELGEVASQLIEKLRSKPDSRC